MSFDMSDHFEDMGFMDLDPEDGPGARRSIIEQFAERGLAVPHDAALSDDDVAARPAHLLFGLESDFHGTFCVYAIPEDAFSETLNAALRKVNNSAYAYHEMMIGDDDARAFVRVEAAALLDEDALVDILEEWEDELEVDLGAQIPKAERGCLAPFEIARFESRRDPVYADGGFDKRFTVASYVKRCQ